MADAIISIVAERVAAVIEDQIRYQVNLLRGLDKELLDLSGKLKTIRNVLDDAEKRGVNEQSVKRWLKKLESMAYEMDGILDEWNYFLLKHKHKMEASAKQNVCFSFIPSSFLGFKKVSVRRITAKKIQNVKASLDQILREKDDFNFAISLQATDPMSKSLKIQSTSLVELEKIHGVDIDRNKNDLVSKLMLDDDSQILSIVGMGGIGKTTLAQLVYNDTQVKYSFELRIWICVSDPFDVDGIARGIVESVKKDIIPPNVNQLELVLEKLRDCISGRKFLLVLDDVWTEDYNKWEPLKINLKYGSPGSKILVTTRNERVAMMMGTLDKEIYRPKQLSDEESWSILRRISLSGRSEEKCGEFEDVGKKIASKCKGLPLAANVLGSLLQFKFSLEEWENVWKSEIWELEKAEVELFPHLVLSYNELSPALKRCFSYCAVYPKDHQIHAESLIEEWMALGYVGFVSGNGRAELKGREYLNNLATRSLFQEVLENHEQIVSCKMHDIVHDFALFLRKNDDSDEVVEMTKRSCQVCDPLVVSQAQKYHSLFWNKKSPIDLCDCVTGVRVLRFEESLDKGLPHGIEKLIHLRWLKLCGTILYEEDLKIICRLYLLQTLLVSSCYISKLPEEIGDLVHLRNFDLSRNHVLGLPEGMCSLVELQILDIQDCYNVNKLPKGFHMLKNLQHLFIGKHPLSRCSLEGVSQLNGLRTLGGLRSLRENEFNVGDDWNEFGFLKNLNLLTGSLTLNIYHNIIYGMRKFARTAGEAELRNKIHIQSLRIIFMSDWNSGLPLPPNEKDWMEVIEALQPYQKLNYLLIHGYEGYSLPHWISSPLNMIKQIHLKLFYRVSSLTPMGKLPLLEDLTLDNLLAIKLIGREFLGIESSSSSSKDVVVFPKLKQLAFSHISQWLEWEDITVEEEESMAFSIMPCLTHLTIVKCMILKKLPHRLLRKASPSLQLLDIEGSFELEESYVDKEGSAWRSISQHNPRLVLHHRKRHATGGTSLSGCALGL